MRAAKAVGQPLPWLAKLAGPAATLAKAEEEFELLRVEDTHTVVASIGHVHTLRRDGDAPRMAQLAIPAAPRAYDRVPVARAARTATAFT